MPSPALILTMTPRPANRVRNLFELNGGVHDVVANPGAFRGYGWDLQIIGDRPKIRHGEYLEIGGNRKLLRLYEDGMLITRGLIDDNFLGWAPLDADFEENPRVHPLAVIEFTTAFVYLYARVVQFFEQGLGDIDFHVEIVNGRVRKRLLYVTPRWDSGDGHTLEQVNPRYDGTFPAAQLTDEPDRVAYELVQRIFLFFSVPGTQIPYTTGADGHRKVDLAAIKRVS
jgi:hypothetical protein